MKNTEQIEAELKFNAVPGKIVSVGFPLFGTVYCCVTGTLNYREESDGDINRPYFVITGNDDMYGIRFSSADVVNITEVNKIKTITLSPQTFANF